MVEAALYTNVGDIMAGIQRVVAWHVHLISWGVSEARLAAIMDGINRRYDALMPGELRSSTARPARSRPRRAGSSRRSRRFGPAIWCGCVTCWPTKALTVC